ITHRWPWGRRASRAEMPADGHGRGRLSTISPIVAVEARIALPRNIVVLDAAMRRIVPRCLQPVKCLVTNCRTGLLPLWHIQAGRAEHVLGARSERKVAENRAFFALDRLLYRFSHRSTKSRRSLPQNISCVTKKVGAAKTQRAIA